MSGLKPCKCGSHDVSLITPDFCVVVCNECGAVEQEDITALQKRIEVLEAALMEIRDLARTGLPPDCIDEQYWRQHKLNQISGKADYALRKGEVKE